MNKRHQELTELNIYIDNIEKETSLLLQNLQWDRKQLIGSTAMVSCQHVASHRIPQNTREIHEKQCYLTQLGYNKEDVLLPDPIDPDADTVVKLSKQDIRQIINTAASLNPSFKKACPGPEPLSAERLQQTYTADERRAIHDAVVSAAPACHDLADLALASSSNGPQSSKVKSRMEILAELRDMKRRRAKYRVAAKTSNYSDVLRDVIKTQMESYAEAKGIFIKTEHGSKTFVSTKTNQQNKIISTNTVIKQERMSPESDKYNESSWRYKERSESSDRRRKERDDREIVSKKRRDHEDYDGSDKNRHKDFYQDKDNASKEKTRYEGYQSKQDKYYKIRNIETYNDRHIHDDDRKDYSKAQKSRASKDSQRSDENPRTYSKNDRYYGNHSSNKYYGSREHYKRDRSYKEDSSRNGKEGREKEETMYSCYQ